MQTIRGQVRTRVTGSRAVIVPAHIDNIELDGVDQGCWVVSERHADNAAKVRVVSAK